MKLCDSNYEQVMSYDCLECNEENCSYRKTGNPFVVAIIILGITLIIVGSLVLLY